MERPVDQGTRVAQWWELGEGLALRAWLFGADIVLWLLTKPQPTCSSWLRTCHALLDRAIRFPSPTVLPLPPVHHLGRSPVPRWVEANSRSHV